jgi:hypothetical protein
MLLVSFALGTPALAHSLFVSRGEIVVHADHVDVHLELAVEDLLHWYDLRPEADGKISKAAVMEAADEHAFVLERALIVRDNAGNRLNGECQLARTHWPADSSFDSLALGRAKYTWKFPLPGATSLLLLQLSPHALPIEIPWQVVLTAHGASQTTGTVLPLTTRGNVEVLELSWDKGEPKVIAAQTTLEHGRCTGCDQRGAARFKELCADIEIGDDGMEVSVSVPLSLLMTWVNVSVDGEAFVSPQEQALVIASARDLVTHSIDVETNDGVLTAQALDIEMVSIAPRTTDLPGGIERLSLWSGRVLARLRFRNPSRLDFARLRWNLFNGGLLSARAVIRADGDCIEHDFSTYRPTLNWQRRTHRGE